MPRYPRASMGPRLISRGVLCHNPPPWGLQGMASMGPRLISRGVRRISLMAYAFAMLQWGRGSLAAACIPPRPAS